MFSASWLMGSPAERGGNKRNGQTTSHVIVIQAPASVARLCLQARSLRPFVLSSPALLFSTSQSFKEQPAPWHSAVRNTLLVVKFNFTGISDPVSRKSTTTAARRYCQNRSCCVRPRTLPAHKWPTRYTELGFSIISLPSREVTALNSSMPPQTRRRKRSKSRRSVPCLKRLGEVWLISSFSVLMCISLLTVHNISGSQQTQRRRMGRGFR